MPETVWTRTTGTASAGNTTLHVDPECVRLQTARAVRSHPRDAYPDDQPICEWCGGDADPARAGGFSGTQLATRLREADPAEVFGDD